MRFPKDTERHVIVGATGSGKTQAALWHLSFRDYEQMPWVIYNYKRDESIDGIPGAQELPTDEIPVDPGVYITHPLPDEDVEPQMWSLWNRGDVGVYVDEGYMVGRNNRAFRALLTQGRSRHVPMIVLSQRPVWMDRFVFSEAEYHQIFRLQHRKDREAVEQFVPADLEKRLPEYHSYYYDVAQNHVYVVRPVPSLEHIHETFRQRLIGDREAVI
jgi:hypothetical protein